MTTTRHHAVAVARGRPRATARRRTLLTIVAGLITTGAAVAALYSPAGGLVVRAGGSGETLAVHRVAAGESFELHHVHSVTRRPVVEVFAVTEGRVLAVRELRFDDFGANLPVGAERIGTDHTTFVADDGGYRVIHPDRIIGTIPLRVGSPQVDHTLVFQDGTKLRLLDIARAHAPVEVSFADDRPLWRRLVQR